MHEEALKLIGQLTPDEGLVILRSLARQDAQTATRIVETITAHLSDDAPQTSEDAAGIAEDLFFELNLLEPEEVWDRAGQTRYGYVEPIEAADEMMREVLEPFLEEMKRYQHLGMDDAAWYTCMGLLAGLYRF